ncbi:MAG: surfeit locus 1 family protein [Rhodobacteraceae bacterium HLUCCA12]|nr:MAG: surfeit locus 1 family protein [Rhodobacteraceae bacterium HLUCCA12]
MARLILPLVFGVAGVAVLMSLGFWQLSRLEEKQAVIAEIAARIGDDPVALPQAPEPEDDRYLPVRAEGRYTGDVAHVLSSQREQGAGSRVIAVFETRAGRRVLVDRGFMPDAARPGADFGSDPLAVTGNLHWPRDATSSTPEPDLERGLWFSREVAPLARNLETEPLMIVAREDGASVPGLTTMPVTTIDIRNDHLEYAITWFLLALVWAGMTGFLLWRIRRGTA